MLRFPFVLGFNFLRDYLSTFNLKNVNLCILRSNPFYSVCKGNFYCTNLEQPCLSVGQMVVGHRLELVGIIAQSKMIKKTL